MSTRTLSSTTVRTFQRVLATAEGLLLRIDTLEGRMTREEIAFLRRVLDGDANVPESAPPVEPMAEAIDCELREGIRRIWEREVREVHG